MVRKNPNIDYDKKANQGPRYLIVFLITIVIIFVLFLFAIPFIDNAVNTTSNLNEIEGVQVDEDDELDVVSINEGIALQLSETTNNMAYYIEDIEFDGARINAYVTADVYSMNAYELEGLEGLIRGVTQTNYFNVEGLDLHNIPTFHLTIYNRGDVIAQTSMFDPSNLKWY